MSVWRITSDKKVTLSETKCNAGVVVEATGEIVEDGKDTAGGELPLSIKWDDGEDPWVGDAPAEYTGIEFTDDDQALEVAVAATEQATTDVEGQAKTFVSMCEKSSAKVNDRWKQAAGEAEDDANDAEDTDDKEN